MRGAATRYSARHASRIYRGTESAHEKAQGEAREEARNDGKRYGREEHAQLRSQPQDDEGLLTMRAYAARSPIDQISQPPDTVQTLLVENSSGQALDWGSTLAQLVRFTGLSTAGAQLNFSVNLQTTMAAIPSSGTSVATGSSGSNIPVNGTRTLQIPPGSTGWSAAAVSSGYIIAEQWRM